MAKILVQVKAADGDKAAVQDWPTSEAMASGQRRYHAILSTVQGEMLEFHLDRVTALAVRSEIDRKLAELPE